MYARIAVAISLVLSCSLPPAALAQSTVLAASPNAITLRWNANDIGEATVQWIAAGHCAATGRSANLGSSVEAGVTRIGSYYCR